MTDKENENKEIIKDLDHSLENVLGQELVNDIHDAIDCFKAEKENSIDDLDKRLNDFLSNDFTITEETNEQKTEDKAPKAGVTHEKPDKQSEANDKQCSPKESREELETRIKNKKIEADLAALKELIKPTSNFSQENNKNICEKEHLTTEQADEKIEKEFTKKDIDNALQQLKAKSSGIKNLPEQKKTEKEEKEVIISDEQIDSSLQDFLKKMD